VGARDAASFKHWVGALREAARGGDVEGVQIALAWLVAHGAPRGSIDNAEGDAEGALAASILESVHIGCDFPMPRLFLSRNTEDGNGRAGQSALGHSVRHGHFAVAQLLIGARSCSIGDAVRWWLSITCVTLDLTKPSCRRADAGADPELRPHKTGRTFFVDACYEGRFEAVLWLHALPTQMPQITPVRRAFHLRCGSVLTEICLCCTGSDQ
jgi:hypothetical protein